MEEGGDPVEMNMSMYFHDVDGDDLEYTYLVPTAEKDVINVYHKDYDIEEHRVIIELTDDGYYGAVLVNVTCTDDEGTLIKQNMLVVVANVPDPPSIDVFPAGNPSAIDETGSLTFQVTGIVDADLPQEGLHTYIWYLDDEEVPDHNVSEYTYTPGYDDAGTHNVSVIVKDPTNLTSVQRPKWTFQVNDKNRAPSVEITTAPTEADEGKMVTLVAEGSDPDNDDLIYTWYLVGGTEDKVLGTGSTLETKELKGGSRMVEVEVSDGKGGVAKDSHTLKVIAKEEGGGLSTMMLVVIVVVVVAVLAAVMMMRGRKAAPVEEARMDLESLQQEYDPSQGRGGGTSGGEAYQSGEGEWESLK
jgi:hypothetical protein